MATSSKYYALVEVQVDPKQMKSAILTASKSTTISPKINLGSKQIGEYVKQWNNQIARMEFKSPDIFKSDKVKNSLATLRDLMSDFAAGGATSLNDVRMGFDDLKTSMAEAGAGMKNTTKDGMSFVSMLDVAIKKIAIWAIGTQAIYGTLNQIKEGVQYIRDLNKELTSLQIVTGQTDEEIAKLGKDYNYLAQEVGATTLEVAQGSLEWARQGKTAKETTVLLKNSMMLSKLAAMDSAEATEKLTAVMNGFKLEVKDVQLALDVLIALDNAYATSAEEIISAMQRSSNSAQLVGIEYNELASQITVVSSVTRKSAESIGESFKTIYSRMRNVKLNKDIDEQGESISDVEKVLKQYGIALRDITTGEFRDFSDVLNETGEMWKELGVVDRSKVANAFAGIKQSENFLVLMNNWDEVKKAQDLAADSAGLAEQRYKIYMEGMEASANRSKAAWESMWEATINEDAIIFFTNLTTVIQNFVTESGGLVEFFKKYVEFSKWITMFPIKLIFEGINKTIKETQGLIDLAFGKTSQSKIKDHQKQLKKLNDEYYLWKSLLKTLGAENSNFYDLVISSLERQIDKTKELLELEGKRSAKTFNESWAADYEDQADAVEKANVALQDSFDTLETLLTDSFGKAWESYNKKQTEAAEQGWLLNQKIQALSDLEYLTPQQQSELDDLKLSLENVKNGILETGAAYEESTRAALISMLIQKISVSDMSSTAKQEGLSMVYSLAQSWGLMSAETIKAMEVTDLAMQKLAEGAYEDARIIVEQAFNIGNALNAISGTYYIDIVLNRRIGTTEAVEAATNIGDVSYFEEQEEELPWNPGEFSYPDFDSSDFLSSFGGSGGAGSSSAAKEKEKTMQALHKMVMTIIKEEQDAKKDALKAEQDALKDQLDAYKDIIDAKKEILNAEKESLEYQDELADQTKNIAKIQNEMAILALDTSAESKARQLELAEELAEAQDELADTQRDRSYDLQEQALEEEYSLYEANINEQVATIEKAIESIDEYLSKSGQIAQDALDRIGEGAPELYQSLIDWNAEYGSGIQNDVVEAWNDAYDALLKYGNLIDALNGGEGGEIVSPVLPTHHSGISSGAVGGARTLPGEILSKLLMGEEVLNGDDILGIFRMIPKVARTMNAESSSGGLFIDKLINVEGNLAKDAVADLNKIVDKTIEKLNNTILKRGNLRSINSIY